MHSIPLFISSDWEVKLRDTSHPEELVVETASTCNLNCIHCFRNNALNFKPQIMKWEIFSKIVENSIEARVSKIVFSGWGEPFTNPHIENMIKICKDRGLEVAINTNGILLERFTDIVIHYVDELYVSLDAATQDTYTFIRHYKFFNKVVESLTKIVKSKQLRGSFKPIVKAIFTITNINMIEIDKFLELAFKIGVNEIILSHAIPYTEIIHNECMDSEDCLKEFHLKFKDILNKFLELGIKITAPSKLGATNLLCPFATNKALFIRSDGVITPCIHYAYSWSPRILGIERKIREVVLGKINKDNLIDVWRKNYAKLFFKLYFRRMPSCLTCSLMPYCVKTRSNEVDCLSNSPTCGHCPYLHRLTFCPL